MISPNLPQAKAFVLVDLQLDVVNCCQEIVLDVPLLSAHPVELTPSAPQVLIELMNDLVEAFRLFVDLFAWGLCQFVEIMRVLCASAQIPQFNFVLVKTTDIFAFAPLGSGILLSHNPICTGAAFLAFFGSTLVGTGVANRAVSEFFGYFVKLEVFVDRILLSEFVNFASPESFVETFGFGEFQSDIGDFFHVFPTFHC